MITTPRDFARIGRLVLDGGVRGNRQIVSGDYLHAMLSPCDLQENYGYLWWLFVGELHGAATRGYLSTDMYLLSDYDVVIVRMQGPIAGYTGAAEDAPYSQRLVAITLGAMVGTVSATDAMAEVEAIAPVSR